MQLVQTNEATAAGRVMTFPLVVDATDGLTPEVGEAAGQPQYSVDGGQNWTNTSATLLGGTNGSYQVQLTQAEVNQSAGVTILGRYKSANTAEARAVPILIVPFDPLAATNLGLTALPAVAPAGAGGLPTVDASNKVAGVSGNVDGSVASVTGAVGSVTGAVGSVTGSVGDLAAAAVNKIWDDLLAGMTQVGSIGKLIADSVTEARLAELDAANLPADVDSLLTRLTAGRAGFLDYLEKLAGAALAGTETAGSLYKLFYDIIKPVGDRTNNKDLDSLLGVPDTAATTVLTELQVYVVHIGVACTGTVWDFNSHLELNGQVITSGVTNGTIKLYDEDGTQQGTTQTDAVADAQGEFKNSITDTPAADSTFYVEGGITYGGNTYTSRIVVGTAD